MWHVAPKTTEGAALAPARVELKSKGVLPKNLIERGQVARASGVRSLKPRNGRRPTCESCFHDEVTDSSSRRADRSVAEILSAAAHWLQIEIIPGDGCTDEECRAVAESQGLSKLPSDFEAHLRMIGHRDGALHRAILRSNEAGYEDLTDPSGALLPIAAELAESADPPVQLRSERVVVLSHEGYLIEYIDGTSNDDPVMQLDERRRPRQLARNFRDWLAMYADATTDMLERVDDLLRRASTNGHAPCVGCSSEDIDAMCAYQAVVELPRCYEAFLRGAGRRSTPGSLAARAFLSSCVAYESIMPGDSEDDWGARETALSILADSGSTETLEHKIVIGMESGTRFYWLPASRDAAPVFETTEGSPMPIYRGQFDEWLGDYLRPLIEPH
jgi:hypothetical protein